MSIALIASILLPCVQFIIDFINDIEKLFDIFNSSKIPKSKDYNRPYKNTEPQINHLNKMTDIFKSIKVIHKYKNFDETNRMNLSKLYQ